MIEILKGGKKTPQSANEQAVTRVKEHSAGQF